MATYAWPSTKVFAPQKATLKIIDNTQRVTESPLSGDVQTTSMPGARWAWDFEFAPQLAVERLALEAYLTRLNGREHRVQLWDIKYPNPHGTVNKTGVTVLTTAAQFASSITLTGCGVGTTILAGCWLGLQGQLVRVVVDAVANAGGQATVEFRHMLRASVPAGSVVTMTKPTGLFVRGESGLSMPRQSGIAEMGFSATFVEVFS